MNRCTICRSPDRAAIEGSLDLGWSQRATAERFGVSASSLSRHRRGHHSEVEEAEREISRLKARQDHLEHMTAVQRVFNRAGWDTPERVGRGVGAITRALVAAEDYETLAAFMRATGCRESAIWSAVETAARGNGADAGEVWESLFAPELEGAG